MSIQRPHRRRRLDLTEQAGFTIIEVLATAIIVSLLAVAVATALITQTQASGDQQLRSEANTLVNQDQDRLRGMTDVALSNLASQGSSTRTVTSGNMTYSVTSSASYQDASGNSSCASTSVDYFKVNTQVTWSGAYGGATQVATGNSLLARPVTGVLETTVVNPAGAPVAGASVVATPSGTTSGSGQSGLSDATGCSVFAGLAPGNYTVTASKSGYVNNQDQSTWSGPASVSNTGTTATAFPVLGLAGSIAATFMASTSSAAPSYPGQADALTYEGSSSSAPVLTQATTTVATHATSLLAGQTSLTTPTSLYPWNTSASTPPSYASNYSVFAGQCSYQNPYPSATPTPLAATVNPGAAASTTVQEPFLYLNSVQATYQNQTYGVTPRDIVLTYTANGCTDQYAATVATGSGGTTYDGVTYGQTVPANGWLADPGQPFAPSGDLTVCVDVPYGSGWASGTTTMGAMSMTARNSVPTININQSGACPGITS